MKKIFNLLILAPLFFMACNDEEFLDKTPHTPSDYSFYTSEDGALQGLNAAYDVLQRGEHVERVEFSGTVCSGDAMAGGEPGGNDQPSLQEMMRFNTNPANTYCLNYWNALYIGIYRCNLLITYLEDPVDNFSDELRNRIRGEALFLRGLFHFKLQINYGGFPQLQTTFGGQLKGVPFIDHILLMEEWNQSRPELDETWSKIEQDFIDAAGLLPVKSLMITNKDENVGRATKGSAQAMLAKTYLYQEKWQQAYEAAKAVIESGEYYLEGETGHEGPYTITRLGKDGEFTAQVPGYKYIWQPEANNCNESIFDVQHELTGSSVYPEGQEGNLIPRYYGPRAVMAYTVVSSDTVFGPVEYFWGFILPTQYFVNTAFEDNGCEDNEGNILDPRFKLSVITGEDKIPFYYEDPVMRAKYPDSVLLAPYYNNPATGYVTWKYFTDPYFNTRRGTLGDMPQNTKYLRFADLLLIGAEAAVNSGHDADALAWVNRVRDRARNSGNTGYPLPLTSVSKEKIWAERRVELAFEGHQFYDIVRTGRATQVLKEDAMQFATSTNELSSVPVQEQFGDAFIVGKNEIWPVPQAEIDNTNGTITQNPNYF
ncbi:MAG: RagB/SusD family nutrient uptake outer membrane protein [Bacteroidales bacterium]|nr:RagB/SusD family nutrient uptake outer membrane protein [Bacteroidales bacterium]